MVRHAQKCSLRNGTDLHKEQQGAILGLTPAYVKLHEAYGTSCGSGFGFEPSYDHSFMMIGDEAHS